MTELAGVLTSRLRALWGPAVEVTAVREDKPVITLRTWAETDEVVMDGTATVLLRGIAAPGGGA